MSKLITLDIRYDPDCPFDWVARHDPTYDGPEPRFPYERGGVDVLGLRFTHRRATTPGPDPYAGDVWTARLGGFKLRLSNVVSCTVEARHGYWKFIDVRRYECKQLPWIFRKLWNFLDYRRGWWEANALDYGDYCC